MITTEQRGKVDKIWLAFHSNGIAIPSDVMEQFNYLVFHRQLDEMETRREKRARITGETYIPKVFVTEEEQRYRWHKLMDMYLFSRPTKSSDLRNLLKMTIYI